MFTKLEISANKHEPEQVVENFESAWSQYVILGELGQGIFGKVYRGYRKDDTNKCEIAIKVIDLSELLKANGLSDASDSIGRQFLQLQLKRLQFRLQVQMKFEIAIWKKTCHNNLVELLSCSFLGTSKFNSIFGANLLY